MRAPGPLGAHPQVSVEPTDVSLGAAITFARRGGFDAYIAVGGGSSMDTAKVMNLYAAQPDAAFLDFVNAPVGAGLAVPATAPIKPLIAVPTTAGTRRPTTSDPAHVGNKPFLATE